jgi:antitoxin (DNA-binding transcriptional repressor) of toxin-antitoxin stability system
VAGASGRFSSLGFRLASSDVWGMQTVTLEEAQRRLSELVRTLTQEGEVTIVEDDQPVARLSPATARTSLRDLKPKSVGAVLHPFPAPEDDTLGEMLDGRL